MCVTKRQSGFELLRIISILMIISYHLYVHGVTHILENGNWTTGSGINYVAAFMCSPGGKFGVASFFMITGYFLSGRNEIKLRSLVRIVLEVLFYSLLTVVVFFIARRFGAYFPKGQDFSVLSRAAGDIFSPLSSNSFWFVSSYVLLVLLAPQLNSIFSKLSRSGMLISICTLGFVDYVINNAFDYKYSNLVTSVFFYAIGYYLAVHEDIREISGSRLRRFLLLALFVESWVLFVITKFVEDGMFFATNISYGCSIIYSAAVPIGVVSLFVLTGTLNFYSEFVNNVAKTTFGIYLIHESNLLRYVIWYNVFHIYGIYYTPVFIPAAVIIVILIFLSGMLIDTVRLKFVEPFALCCLRSIRKSSAGKFFRSDKHL